MSDKTLLMAEAMSYLDDRYIEEAHCEARGVAVDPIHRRKTISRIALVACLCLIAIGVARLPALMDKVSDMGVGNAAPEGEGPISPGMFDENNGNVEGNPPVLGENTEGTAPDTETEALTEALSAEN